jgi:hypothetical protein
MTRLAGTHFWKSPSASSWSLNFQHIFNPFLIAFLKGQGYFNAYPLSDVQQKTVSLSIRHFEKSLEKSEISCSPCFVLGETALLSSTAAAEPRLRWSMRHRTSDNAVPNQGYAT